MATPRSRVQVTERDVDLLTAVDLLPLTAEQLLRYSQTFRRPFTQLRLVQRRLHLLETAGYLRSWPYAMATNGRSPRYFKLTRDGFRLLHGRQCLPPSRRYFEAIADNHHNHTRLLADFLVHLATMSYEQGIALRHFARENTVRIETGQVTLYPDAAFQLVARNRTYNFLVELDNSTERIRSRQDIESIERKIRGYDSHQRGLRAFDAERYVVLFVTTRSAVRLDHILQAASDLMSNPQRRLFLGTDLASFLRHPSPVTERCFRDNRGWRTSLIPARPTRKTASRQPTQGLRPTFA